MSRRKALVVLAAIGALGALPLLGLGIFAAIVGGALSGPGAVSQPASALASSQIPALWLALVQQAASRNGVCQMSWTILAAIADQESSFGTSSLPGVHSGANSAGAEGPMQFLPATFAEYDEPVPPGGADPPSPYDPTDAVYAAARMLCSDGVDADPSQAVFDYNHSAAYVSAVLERAASYAALSPSTGSTLGLEALGVAESYIGTPYVWGGDSPGGFDCSGLVQWVYAEAGLSLPRTAQAQFDTGPEVPVSGLAPGDLVFFGSGPGDVTHVGIYAGGNEMVDAPYTGADVRHDSFTPAPDAPWGSDVLLGATEPGAAS
jgi:cell wall-associated NlpC family hydrolase